MGITGTSLGLVTSLDFHGTSADFSMDSDTHITATVPAGATAGTIGIQTDSGDVVDERSDVHAGRRHRLLRPDDRHRRNHRDDHGRALHRSQRAVKFSGVAASSFTVVNDHTITAAVPTAAISGVVSVVAPSATAASSDTFTVLPRSIRSCPRAAAPATRSSCAAPASPASARSSSQGVDATFTPVSSTRVDAVVPDAAGTGPVTIFADQGVVSSASDFTVNARIDSILPTSGPAGSTVLITGHNFGAVLDVQFNGVSTVFGARRDRDADHRDRPGQRDDGPDHGRHLRLGLAVVGAVHGDADDQQLRSALRAGRDARDDRGNGPRGRDRRRSSGPSPPPSRARARTPSRRPSPPGPSRGRSRSSQARRPRRAPTPSASPPRENRPFGA